jgi:CubicO group peptidase (beta-lactamase class C family)
MADIHGSYDRLFVAVPNALSVSLDESGGGASVAVFVDGEPVVDVWGGFTDADRSIPWQQDTITNVWSVTKTVTALCALVLADRGELDFDAPVARYWPEFATAGKEGVLVRHVLSHTAGLPFPDGATSAADCYDWDGITGRLAAQATAWEPGTAAGYHSLTQGFLIGEVIRRITGRTVGDFLADEVAGPLGADFHIGLPVQLDRRVAPLIPPPSHTEEFTASAAGGSAGETGTVGGIRVRDGNSAAWRRAQIPAANGFGNARSVALLLSAMACGGTVRGTRLLSEITRDRALEVQYRGEDRVLGMSVAYGLGFGVFGRSFGWGGWGGSLAIFEPDNRMAVAYVTNQMLDHSAGADNRGMEMVMASYDGVKALSR